MREGRVVSQVPGLGVITMYRYYYNHQQTYQENSYLTQPQPDYSDKTQFSAQAKDSVTLYARDSAEPVTLYQSSDQYFTDHQNDKILPGQSLEVIAANRNQFKISLRSERGQQEVVLQGDKALFMKTIKLTPLSWCTN